MDTAKTQTIDSMLNKLADEFCRWPLPPGVRADACACEPGYPNRTGTNLLTYIEAKQMFRDLVLPMLALLKSYPIEPSGACSIHRGGDKTGECPICWPDLWVLVGEHSEVNRKLVEERNQLRLKVRQLETDPFRSMRSWLKHYDAQHGTNHETTIMDWVNQQPMTEG